VAVQLHNSFGFQLSLCAYWEELFYSPEIYWMSLVFRVPCILTRNLESCDSNGFSLSTKLEKAFEERRYLRQGKAIRQVASLSSLCQRFAYAPFNAMVTKISKWSRIQDFCRITPKIEPLVVYAMPNIPSKLPKDPSITFRVIAWTHRQTNKQTNK